MNETQNSYAAGTNALLDSAATTAGQAIRSSQRAAHQAVDRFADGVDDVRVHTGAALGGLASGAEQLTRRGATALREGSQRVREQTLHAADATRGYIRDEPVKSVLIAAAAGAVLVGLLALFGRSSVARR